MEIIVLLEYVKIEAELADDKTIIKEMLRTKTMETKFYNKKFNERTCMRYMINAEGIGTISSVAEIRMDR